MEEIWKDVIGYEGLYQVSNFGNVKSLNYKMTNQEKLLKPGINSGGYYLVVLFKNKHRKSFNIHQLVAMAFLNHTPCGYKLIIDHLNDNKLDNTVENLQLVTARFNTCKTQGAYTSKYKGVSWIKNRKKWQSQININGKKIYLGRYKCELAAHLAYQNKLKEIIL